MIVVADASPLHYLVLIEQIAVLSLLYGQVLVPSVVCEELQRPQTPEEVRLWMAHPPPLLDLRPPRSAQDQRPRLPYILRHVEPRAAVDQNALHPVVANREQCRMTRDMRPAPQT